MKQERYHLTVDTYDRNIILNALNTLRNQQVRENRATEPVDSLILKVSYASTKRVRTDYSYQRGER